MTQPFFKTNMALLDLKYEYLSTGYRLIAYTDVPCHLYCRMTKTPPQKHPQPVLRRGVLWRNDIRFCFVVYEDNEQEEGGDTIIHTFIKENWEPCETRYFYFLGTIDGKPVPSDTAIFTFRFPAPPPAPPPAIVQTIYAETDNRTTQASALTWPPAHNASSGTIMTNYDTPMFNLFAGSYLSGGWHYIWRSFLRFNTTALNPSFMPISAVLSLWVHTTRTTAERGIYVTRGVQHSPVIPTDYGAQLPITDFISYKGPVPAGAYQDFPFNEDGLAVLNPGGYTKLCIRGAYDLLDLNPISVYSNYAWYYSAQKGEPYKPKLTITYQPVNPNVCP